MHTLSPSASIRTYTRVVRTKWCGDVCMLSFNRQQEREQLHLRKKMAYLHSYTTSLLFICSGICIANNREWASRRVLLSLTTEMQNIQYNRMAKLGLPLGLIECFG